MGVASYKHEIKTLFLVINSFIALGIGLLPLSIGVGLVLSKTREPEVIFWSIAVGTLILGLSSLGHYGAVVEKRGILRVYAVVAGLATLAEAMAVTKLIPLHSGALIFVIFFTAITLSATILATLLAKQTRGIYPVVPLPSVLAATPTAPAVL